MSNEIIYNKWTEFINDNNYAYILVFDMSNFQSYLNIFKWINILKFDNKEMITCYKVRSLDEIKTLSN